MKLSTFARLCYAFLITSHGMSGSVTTLGHSTGWDGEHDDTEATAHVHSCPTQQECSPHECVCVSLLLRLTFPCW